MLIETFHRTTFQRLSTRAHETTENMSVAPSSMQRPESKVHEGFSGAFVLKRIKCVEVFGSILCMMGLCSFLGQLLEEVQRAKADGTAESSLCRALGELVSGEWLVSFVNCVGKRMWVDMVTVSDGDVRVVQVERRVISGGFFRSIDDYD